MATFSYRLTLGAEEDLHGIWAYTHQRWGSKQADVCFDQIEACFEAIVEGRARSKTLTGLPEGVHVCRCQHHYIFWHDQDRPTFIALLHERMDLVQRLIDRL